LASLGYRPALSAGGPASQKTAKVCESEKVLGIAGLCQKKGVLARDFWRGGKRDVKGAEKKYGNARKIDCGTQAGKRNRDLVISRTEGQKKKSVEMREPRVSASLRVVIHDAPQKRAREEPVRRGGKLEKARRQRGENDAGK